MTLAGIDPSLSSTGITIWNGKHHYYYQIVHKMTKKMKEFKDKYIKVVQYEKISSNNEVDKFTSISNLVDQIESILLKHNVEFVVLEGIAFNAIGRTSDLTGLSYLIRNVCYNNNIQFVVVPATTIKKESTGNGAADKELIVNCFLKCTDSIEEEFPGKIDDIADSYFMCHLPQHVIEWYKTH